MQVDALTRRGCDRIFIDTGSGALAERPELTKLLDYARGGDTLVVWWLDRLGRSIRNLIDQIDVLQSRGIGFISLQENIDTTTSGGRLVFHIFSALAQFERDLIRERTEAGLAAARAQGRVGGRPEKLTPAQITRMKELTDKGDLTITEIAKMFGINRTTVRRTLNRHYDAPVTPEGTRSA